MIRSFRLTPEAAANLDKIANDYKITPNKIINLLLTENTQTPYLENNTKAAEIIEEYFADIIQHQSSCT